jgi:hypothetical protein
MSNTKKERGVARAQDGLVEVVWWRRVDQQVRPFPSRNKVWLGITWLSLAFSPETSAFFPHQQMLPTPMSSPQTVTKTQDSTINTNDLIFHCRVCFKGLSTEKSADKDRPPFWVTSCGHVVCSEHVFPNGSEFTSSMRNGKQKLTLSI